MGNEFHDVRMVVLVIGYRGRPAIINVRSQVTYEEYISLQP